MKSINGILYLIVFFVIIIGCKNSDTNLNVETKDATFKKEIVAATTPKIATFHIEGMTCAVGCAKTIEKKLSEMEGVQNANINFETKTATVNFDLDKLKPDDLVNAAESCADGKTYKVSNLFIEKQL